MHQVLVINAYNARDHRTCSVVARRFPVLIGRDPRGATCVLDDEHVSKIHASLHLQGDQIFARDPGSVNGTFTKNRRISSEWIALGSASVPQEIRIRDWVITAHAEQRAAAPTEEMSLSDRLGIRYADPNALSSTVADENLECAQTVGEGLKEAAARLQAVFDDYQQKALELYTQLSEHLGRLPAAQRAAACAYFENLLPGLTESRGFERLFEQYRAPAADAEATKHAANEGVKYLARRYVGRELANAQDLGAFLARLTETIDATVHGHAPLLASLDRFETDMALERTLSKIPRSPSELARALLDWNEPTGQTTRAFERSFAEVAMHGIGMMNGFMSGVKVLLRELAPETIRHHWHERQGRRDPVTRILGAMREAHELLALHALRHGDLADEESEAFRVIFGREFAEEYGKFKREEIAPEPVRRNGKSTPYRDLEPVPVDTVNGERG